MAEPTKEATDEALALQEQQELLESCLELVFATYDAALADKVSEPVVMLLDCEDEIGGQIAGGWLGVEAVQNAIAEQRLEDPSGQSTTVYAQAFPMAECRREVPQFFSYLAPVFSVELPADSFLAIAVTSGGASALTVPDSARESNN